MNKHAKTVWSTAIVAVVVIIGMFLWFYGRHRSRVIACGEGPRQTIDIGDFDTRYSAYSMQFKASIQDLGRFEGKLEPIQLQKISESLQSANEFRKYLVAGYNSCAISSREYGEYAARYQALDGLARQMDALSAKAEISGAEKDQLGKLGDQYLQLSALLALPSAQ